MNTVQFLEWKCEVKKFEYANGGPALQLVDAETGEPIARATAWVEGLAADEVAIKDYSENAGIYRVLVDAGIITKAHRTVLSGHAALLVCHLK